MVGESSPQTRDRVRSVIRRADACTREPMPCREPLIVKNSGFEEVHNVLMLPIFGAVARDVKCRVARGMLGKLVTPKVIVWAALRDPILIHVLQEVVFTKWLEESPDIWPLVRRHRSSIGQAIRCIWRRRRIILSVEIATLGERSVIKVGPQPMKSPGVVR